MEELTVIPVNIENEDFSTEFSLEEAIDFLKISPSPEIKEYYKENPQELLSQLPNQIVSLVLKDTTKLELENKDYAELVEIVCDEIGLNGQIEVSFNKRISSSKTEYKVHLRAEEDSKKENINNFRRFKELILVKGFQASTNYGKVAHADIPKHVLNVTPKEMDLRIITKLLGNNNNVTYICFSDTVYRKFTEILNEDEYRSVQVDISDYVEDLEKTATSQLFIKICPGQYPSEIIQELGNMRTRSYRGVAKLWTVIESTLGNIARNLGCTGDSLGEYLDYLSSNNSHRRLFEETKCLVKALDRNNQAHGRLFRSDTDQRYFAILCMKAIRDIYFNWCFFQSLDLCFPQVASDLSLQIDDIWKIYPNENIPRKKIVVTNSEDWGSENLFEILFEDLNAKQKKRFKFKIKLIENLIISIEQEVLL